MSVKSKSGYIYLVHAIGTNRYKIGLTTRTVEERLAELNSSQSAYPLESAGSIFVENVHEAERYFHKKYAHFQVHNEWFEFSQKQANLVKKEFQNPGKKEGGYLLKICLFIALGLAFIWIQNQPSFNQHTTKEHLHRGTRN